MQLSCKITASILRYLDEQSEDVMPLLESISVPEELLRDPSYWIDAVEMEAFLERSLSLYSQHTNMLVLAGHQTAELRSWGVLDSVLRMMPKPQEIFNQPEKFISYFISPAPPIAHMQRSEDSVQFDIPVSSELYPLATQYLAAAFESLPSFVGQAHALCKWQGIHVELKWSHRQTQLFDVDMGRQISPELMQSIVDSLQAHQKDLEEKNRDLSARLEQLQKAKDEIEHKLHLQAFALQEEKNNISKQSLAISDSCPMIQQEVAEYLNQEISRLADYMVRSQQLITLLVAQDRNSTQVKNAMKRVDWERVQQQFPVTVQQCREVLKYAQLPATPTSEMSSQEV